LDSLWEILKWYWKAAEKCPNYTEFVGQIFLWLGVMKKTGNEADSKEGRRQNCRAAVGKNDAISTFFSLKRRISDKIFIKS
jgi:hypothetical protein